MPDIMLMGKNPNYLGSWDIEILPNKEIVLTIDEIVDGQVVDTKSGSEKVETLCYFVEQDVKPMILNVTNKKTLVKLYKTKDTDGLKGKRITIGIEKVKAFGAIHDVLRIRKTVPPIVNAVAPKCEECGKDIAPAHGMTSEQMAAYTLKGYGKKLCSECAMAAKKAKEEKNGT